MERKSYFTYLILLARYVLTKKKSGWLYKATDSQLCMHALRSQPTHAYELCRRYDHVSFKNFVLADKNILFSSKNDTSDLKYFITVGPHYFDQQLTGFKRKMRSD